MRKRIVLIANIISPYRIQVFNYLRKVENLDFELIFLAETESVRKKYAPEWIIKV